MIYHIHLLGKPDKTSKDPMIEVRNHAAKSDQEAIDTATKNVQDAKPEGCYGFFLTTQDGREIYRSPISKTNGDRHQ